MNFDAEAVSWGVSGLVSLWGLGMMPNRLPDAGMAPHTAHQQPPCLSPIAETKENSPRNRKDTVSQSHHHSCR